MDPLLSWIASYGYLAIFALLALGIVGLPVPDETLLVFSGYLISRGRLHPLGALSAALLGSMCGISLSYSVGRTLGLGAVHRFGKWLRITNEDIERVHQWFHRLGHWALAVGYFIPGVRHFTAIVAGTSGLEYREFATFAYSGALVWVSTFLTLGYFLGDQWERAFQTIHRHLVVATIAVGGALGIYLLVRWSLKRR